MTTSTLEKQSKQDQAMARALPGTALAGVHHSARPTWKLAETIAFYRDVLGLPLVHTISARGWGRPGHPDFLHFFFDSGQGSTIAFFRYIGTDRPEWLQPRIEDWMYRSTHTAWRVETREELIAWKERLEKKGVEVSPYTRHEAIESIYFTDPNGYPFEITLQLREFETRDAVDAELTLRAAVELEAQGKMDSIDAVWRRKAELVKSLPRG